LGNCVIAFSEPESGRYIVVYHYTNLTGGVKSVSSSLYLGLSHRCPFGARGGNFLEYEGLVFATKRLGVYLTPDSTNAHTLSSVHFYLQLVCP